MKVDVVLLTRDSNKPFFQEVLESLYRNIPVNRLVVVDGGSTDGTIETLKKYDNVEVYHDIGGTRGSSRQIGILRVNTEWFFFLDSDVILHEGWYEKAHEFTENGKVGAIQGWEIPVGLPNDMSDYEQAMDKLARIIRGKSVDRVAVDRKSRGFTGCVLIRRSAVEGIRIPPQLHDYEDWYIKRYIEKKGYEWLTIRDLEFTHFHKGGSPEDSFYTAYIATFTGFLSLETALQRTVTILPKALFALCLRPNPKMALNQMKSQMYTLVGCLKFRFASRKTRK